jgi:molybdenum cofactor biosynthesis enzyme MoaA
VINIDRQGRLFLCKCDGWVPFSIGHVLDFSSFDEIFSAPLSQKIQNSVSAGTFDYCDVRYCGITEDSIHQDGYYISLGIDDSCNLQCPSCRSEMIFNTDSDYINERFEWIDRVQHWINQEQVNPIKILIGSNGDPFASVLYRRMMQEKMPANITYEIRTNGLLLKKHLPELPIASQIDRLEISIDAASPAVYHDVRRPGKWAQLIENLDYVTYLRQSQEIKLIGFFVIQAANLGDVIPFIDLCARYRMQPGFTLLQDWGSWNNFGDHCVQLPEHPMHSEFLKTMNHPKFRRLNLDWARNYMSANQGNNGFQS